MNLSIVASQALESVASSLAQEINTEYSIFQHNIFPDQEITINVDISNVKNTDVLLMLNMYPDPNRSIVELMLLHNIFIRNNKRVILFVPYISYLRSDVADNNTSIGSMAMLNFLYNMHFRWIITIAPHIAPQHANIIIITIDELLSCINIINKDCVIVAPDFGIAGLCSHIAHRYSCAMIVVRKLRDSNNVNGYLDTELNIKNKRCIIIDDVIGTGATIELAARLLLDGEVQNIDVISAHLLLSGHNPYDKLQYISNIFLPNIYTNDLYKQIRVDHCHINIINFNINSLIKNALNKILN